MPEPRYRFLMINAFSLPGAGYGMRPADGPKEAMLMNHDQVAHLLADVAWDIHPGAPATHGELGVELREEFLIAGANRLPLVRAGCESGKYDAIVLLGGGDPGFLESREIGRRYGLPVTSCAHAQMHVAGLLGHRFSILDISEAHNVHMAGLVVQYRMEEHCASVRCCNFPLPRKALPNDRPIAGEKAKHDRGEASPMVEAMLAEAVAAVEEDGAEVLIIGCSAAYWLCAPLQHRLAELGWEVPVLEGYRCAIEVAKTLVDLKLDASGLAFPSDHPRRWRRRKRV